ncbi:MAG: S9 family peptidase, partial [Pyrinomonadaceae bacterium]|nr:S9 family peptidase [Pyrinomonadaceae bacterium]
SVSGLEPRDLYLASTGGGEPRLLVRAVDEEKESRPAKTETRDEARTSERKEERVMQRDAAQEARERSVTGIEWSPDSRRLLFSKRGDLYVLNLNETPATPRRLTSTVAVEGGAQWLADSRRILYQSGGNLFVVDADQTSLVQLTREGGAAAARKNEDGGQQQQGAGNATVSSAQASEDGARVAYIVSDTSKQRALFVPNYTGEFVTAPTVRRGWAEQRVQVVKSDGTSEQAVTVKLPAPEGVSYIRGLRWTPDSMALIIDRIDRDTKRRQIFIANITDGAATLVEEETDAKWIAPLSRIMEVSPKGDQLLFASERDGFNHLYVTRLKKIDGTALDGFSHPDLVPLLVADATKERQEKPLNKRCPIPPNVLLPVRSQLTCGALEVNWAKWLPDGRHVIYSSTNNSTAEREFSIIGVPPYGVTSIMPIKEGMNTDPQLSKNGEMLIYEHSEWNVPNDIYALSITTKPLKLARVTRTVPERFNQISWTRPEFTEFKAKDGKMVKARVYTPLGFNKQKKYPAVVFVHGAGYLQNVINGWNNYYREAMFHHILTERGYVVLDIDYRGSAGYGREWRTDVYDFLGGLDYQDHLDGIDFIVKNYAVDETRVGMYGGSYGGFMAEMAAMRAPERVACAAALRPVADWKNYYASSPIYTAERLGFPDKNAEAYKRSSPITYAEDLRRPLLILHGMVDDNVHFQDSVQLIEKLIKLGKSEYFEVMFYPAENHAFTKPESWTDEYERI